MLKWNASRTKDMNLRDKGNAFRDIDLRGVKERLNGTLKGVDPSVIFAAGAGVFEGMRHMRRDHEAERRNTAMLAGIGAAAMGATFMYFFDPEHGESRRASARERIDHWYRNGRGQLDRSWRQLQSEGRTYDLTEKGRAVGTAEDPRAWTPRDDTGGLAG